MAAGYCIAAKVPRVNFPPKKPTKEELANARSLIAAASAELERRNLATRFAAPGGLMEFVRHFWSVLEPSTPLIEGWAMEAICAHLEAVSRGEVTRLLINVPPGFSKSLITNVYWPAWEWAVINASLRYVTFSYAATLTERDNGRFRAVVLCDEYRDLFPHVVLERFGDTKIANTSTGWKFASSIEGVGTGERGDRVLLDDPNRVGESKLVLEKTASWFRQAMLNRLNDQAKSAIVIIMQRLHELDVSGTVLTAEMPYVHLNIPMEFDELRACSTTIGWSDPRTRTGELAWPERFPATEINRLKRDLGPTAYAGQYSQSPTPIGGGIFQPSWWQLWDNPQGVFPLVEFIVASLDGAFTSKEENDPSALTVWGVWTHIEGGLKRRRVILMNAWRKFLPFSGERILIDRRPNEALSAWRWRTREHWGLMEWVKDTCEEHRVHVLLIEAKGPGISAAQELRNRFGELPFSIQLVQPKGDKIARALSCQPIFSNGIVYAPDRSYAQLVIDEAESFPKGRHDDLVDSLTMALSWLRNNGLLATDEEVGEEMRRSVLHHGKKKAIYPC